MLSTKKKKVWDDKNLKQGLLCGDEASLEFFYKKYFTRLYRYIYYRVGHDHHHTEEVINDTFLEALEKIERFDLKRGSMEAWLITMSRNRIRSLNSIMGKAREHESSWTMLEGELDTIFSEMCEISEQEAAINNEELSNLVSMVMGSLPQGYSKLLEMKYLWNMSTREIAYKMEKTEKAIESKLTRARTAFKQIFLSAETDSQYF